MKKVCAPLLVILTISMLAPMAAHADGLVIIDPPPPQGPAFLTVVSHHVEITIEDQVATTKIDEVFRNDSEGTVEGTYIFPIPEEATIERFVMYVEGKPLEGKVLSREEARAIYESIVQRRRDPALLEYIGHDLFQASIFPINAHEEKRIQIEYRQVLPMDQGLVQYSYPLSTERFSPVALENVAITVQLSSKDPIRAVYSPSHDVGITREDDYHATIGYEASQVFPDRDFVLYYTVSNEEIGVNLITYHPHGEDGFFLLLVAPPVETRDREVVAKDVIFVLDTSGSMEGEKIAQARDALLFVLDHLNREDRFAIVSFNSAVSTYLDELSPASERERAHNYVEGLAAGGSTDIDQALQRAFALSDEKSGRPQVILFLTDGQPTVGEQEPTRILENARTRSGEGVRLFPFGLGYDVNSALLDSLAEGNHGASAYILPDENLEERVSAFYSKITSPVLAGIDLDFGDIIVENSYPNPLPDLFLGGQMVLVGRYRDGGRATVKLSGKVNGKDRSYSYEGLDFQEENIRYDFLPRLWASRKIGYLLSEVRLHGENEEVIKEIVDLSLRYGIITPYTSFLVDETGRVLTEDGSVDAYMAFSEALPAAAPTSGAGGFYYSRESQNLKDSSGSYSGVTNSAMRQVGDKAFLLANGVWTDTTYKMGDPTTKLTFGGQSYFDLLTAHPEWGRFFALGERVIVVLDGVAYETVAEEAPPVTAPPALTPTVGPWEETPETPYPPLANPSYPLDPTAARSPWGWVVGVAGALVLGVVAVVVLVRRRAE